MIGKGILGAVVLGTAVAIGSVANAGWIQGTHIETDLPGPFHITSTPDGSTLIICNQSSNSITLVDSRSRKVIGEVSVGVQPEAAAVTPDGSFVYVCNGEADSVSVVDIARKQTIKEIKVGDWPSGVSISSDGKTAYVACSGSMWNTIDVIDTGRMEKIRSIYTSDFGPRTLALSPDGKTMAVILDTVGKILRSVDFIDLATGKVIDNRVITGSSNLRDVVYTPDGKYIAVTYQTPKNWLPVCEAENGQIFTNNIAIIETKKGGKVARMPLDELNNYDGNPYGLAMAPDGKYLYIGIRGMHRVTILDMDKLLDIVRCNSQEELDYLSDDLGLIRDYLVARIPTGLGPSSVSLSPDGKTCYAANYFSNNITVISVGNKSPRLVTTIQTGPEWEPLPRAEPLTVPEVQFRVKHSPFKSRLVRYGQFQFNDAAWSLQGQYSCASCHYERGQTTGVVWDLGDEGWGSWKNAKYIRGGRYLPPFRHEGFTGHPDEIVGATSSLDRVCGRDPGFVFRSENFSNERLEALICYIRALEFTGSPFRNEDGSLSESQIRGEEVFNDPEVGCAECHPGESSDPRALYSDAQTHDVGTGRVGVNGFRSTPGKVFNLTALEAGEDPYGEESNTPIIGLDLVKEFDTPTLRDIYASGTYFHDGSARTLMDTINNTVTDMDMHGRTSHLSEQQLNDLVEFMKAL